MFQYIEPRPGNFVDVETGKVVGKHKGNFCAYIHVHIFMKIGVSLYWFENIGAKTVIPFCELHSDFEHILIVIL